VALPINIDELLHGNTVEWDRIELKKGWNPKDIIHSLCAYANDINNWDGGYILVGVEEENGVAKLPPYGLNLRQIDSIQKKLIELSYKISPAYIPASQPYIKDGKHILIIWAPAGDNRPYKAPVSLSEKKSEKAWYIKRGSKTVKVKDGSDDERRLLELTARIPFDDRINQSATLDDLSLQLIQSHLKEIMSLLYEESTKISFQDLCKQMKIAKGPDENLRPTNVGLLLFNEHPDNFFAGAKIELVIHKGKVGKDYVEKIFTGPIVKQVRDVLNFINTNTIQEQVSKAQGQAEAVRFFNYPYQAIEEVLVNAVYHRSYERENPVEIQIHPDKIEILSFPGPMPPVDKEMLKKERIVTREYRNRKLGGFLKELKLTEGRGTGFPIIYKSLEINGSPPPIFETDDDRYYFLSIIKVHPLTQQVESQGVKDMTKDETKDKELLINSLSDIDNYLRSLDDLRWAQVEKKIKSKVDRIFLKALLYCISPKTREEIFEHMKIYNNSRNFKNYIKPIIEVGWLQLTIPDKPTSKNQKYITSDVAKRLVEPKKTGIKRLPVASSNIATVGYDAENKILEIEFHHGAIYRYFDVPQEVYEKLMSAGSQASFFYHNIRENYEYQKT
jgi:ATP-dependent DNA helicase RecG